MTDTDLELLQEFRNLYAHDLPDLSNQSVLMFLLKKAVQHKKQKLGLIEKDAQHKKEQPALIKKSERLSNAPLPSAADVKVVPKLGINPKGVQIEKQRKPLTAKIKRMVWKRANASCEHIDAKSKNRCSSKFALETDHIIAVALGGTNDLENLQLLCRAHNSRRSIKTFGPRL